MQYITSYKIIIAYTSLTEWSHLRDNSSLNFFYSRNTHLHYWLNHTCKRVSVQLRNSISWLLLLLATTILLLYIRYFFITLPEVSLHPFYTHCGLPRIHIELLLLLHVTSHLVVIFRFLFGQWKPFDLSIKLLNSRLCFHEATFPIFLQRVRLWEQFVSVQEFRQTTSLQLLYMTYRIIRNQKRLRTNLWWS